jgi:hypothetical protein
MKEFPSKIKFTSDGNEAKLLEIVADKKSPLAKYQYTKSKTKLNNYFTTTLDNLNRLVSDGLVKV